jgi:hypothetical protein
MRNDTERELDRLFDSLSALLQQAYAARGSVAAVAGDAVPIGYLTANVRELATLVADVLDDVEGRLKRLNVLLNELQLNVAT